MNNTSVLCTWMCHLMLNLNLGPGLSTALSCRCLCACMKALQATIQAIGGFTLEASAIISMQMLAHCNLPMTIPSQSGCRNHYCRPGVLAECHCCSPQRCLQGIHPGRAALVSNFYTIQHRTDVKVACNKVLCSSAALVPFSTGLSCLCCEYTKGLCS